MASKPVVVGLNIYHKIEYIAVRNDTQQCGMTCTAVRNNIHSSTRYCGLYKMPQYVNYTQEFYRKDTGVLNNMCK